MPEQPGPPEQPESGPAFDINPEEATNIGLTNNELMRYHWTGEMPPHVQELERQTFRDQTRPGAQKFWVTEQEHAMAAAASADIPRFNDYDQYRVWSLQELDRLSKQITRSIADPQEVPPAEVAKLGERWEAASRLHWSVYEDFRIADATEPFTAIADDILDSPKASLETKADLLEATASALTFSNKSGIITTSLNRHTELNGPGLMIHLLDRPTIMGTYARRAISDLLTNAKTPQAVEHLGTQLIVPLAQRVKRMTKSEGTSEGVSEMELMSIILDAFDRTDVTMKQAKANDINFQQIADTIFEGYEFRTERIKQGSDWLFHSDAQTIITVLDKLYLPEHGPALKLPSGLSELLEGVYQHKLEHYGSRRDIDNLRRSFNRLAEACGSKLRTYKTRA